MKPNVKGIVKHNISPEYSFKWAYVTEDGGKNKSESISKVAELLLRCF